jgi:hypothetical protein
MQHAKIVIVVSVLAFGIAAAQARSGIDTGFSGSSAGMISGGGKTAIPLNPATPPAPKKVAPARTETSSTVSKEAKSVEESKSADPKAPQSAGGVSLVSGSDKATTPLDTPKAPGPKEEAPVRTETSTAVPKESKSVAPKESRSLDRTEPKSAEPRKSRSIGRTEPKSAERQEPKSRLQTSTHVAAGTDTETRREVKTNKKKSPPRVYHAYRSTGGFTSFGYGGYPRVRNYD